MQTVAHQLFLITTAPFVGSFLGVVIERLPADQSFLTGRSRCAHCGGTLAARDLIPLISWLVNRGRCRQCAATISLFYPAIELAALAIAAWSVLVAPDPAWLIWPTAALGWLLLTAAWIDQQTLLLPTVITLPLALVGLVVVWLIDPALLVGHLIGAALGFAGFLALANGYQAIRHRDGLGRGDVMLLAALGAWLGWQGLPTVLLYASTSGLLWMLAQHASGKTMQLTRRLPFGPHLCLAGWLVWLYGPLQFG